MKVTIFAAGSRGDIQPCVVLGQRLKKAGYSVRLAAPENFSAFVQEHGIEFYGLHGDVQQIMASDTGQAFMQSGGANPIKSVRVIRTMIGPVIMDMVADAFTACQGADALICLGVISAFGQTIAEALNIPMIHIEPTPLLPTKAFPAPSWPLQKNLGGAHNYLSGRAMLQVIWAWYQPFVNAFRKIIGLPVLNAAGFFRKLKTTPMLSAYSPHVIPHPVDWPENIHLTGFFFPDDLSDWQPSAELDAFLKAGDPPVYIGFGSMAGSNPEQLACLALEALAQSGQRGLLLTGWGGLRPERVPDDVFVLDSAPHHWLFPQMSAVVHHGGAGTTAEGLRAGVPSVIVPFIMDQFFWGARVKALGVSPAPIPHKKLTAERLAQAIRSTVANSDLRQQAAACGAAIRAENGVENAVKIIQSYLGQPAQRQRVEP